MKIRESLAVKLPEQGVLREDVGIVLLNHVGSSNRQDSGRDAQFLANCFNVMAIAADRPTSYALPRNSPLARQLQREPIKAMFNLATKVDSLLNTSGVRQVIVAGRSAGGLGALELAQTEGVQSVSLVYAAEPVGCRELSVKEGQMRFKDYAGEQSALLKADALLEEPKFIHPLQDAKDLPLASRLSRLATMGPLFATDRYYNKNHWNQNVVPGYLAHLALEMGQLTHVDFAEHSFVLPTDPGENVDFVSQIYEIAGESDEKLSVDVMPGTTHASFDNRHYFAERVSTVALLQADLELS